MEISSQQKLFESMKAKPILFNIKESRSKKSLSTNTIRNSNEDNVLRDGTYVAKKDFIESELFSLHVVYKDIVYMHRNNMIIQGLLKKLHTLFIHYKVTDFYSYYFMARLISASEHKLQDSIIQEINQLKEKRSYFHQITKVIEAREICLKQMEKCLRHLQSEAHHEEGIDKLESFGRMKEQIKNYRKLTLLVIEQISLWKQNLKRISLNSLDNEHQSFMYKGQDYLIKLLNDNMFIFNSFLSGYVKFSQKNDPFLMKPYISVIDSTNKETYSLLFQFTPEEQTSNMQMLHFLAEERAQYLKRKIINKEDKIKEIQRIYQTKNSFQNLSSQIFVKKLNIVRRGREEQEAIKTLDFVQDKKNINPSHLDQYSQKQKNKFSEITEKQGKLKKIKDNFQHKFDQSPYNSSENNQINLQKIKLLNKNKLNNNYFSQQNLKRPISISFKTSAFQVFSKYNDPIEYENQTDFQQMVRKKQLKVLQDSVRRKTFSSKKLQDKISERKLISNKKQAEELQKIIEHLEQSSPQRTQSFIRQKMNELSQAGEAISFMSPHKLKTITIGKTLLEQNQQVVMQLRNKVMKEIEVQKQQRVKHEETKKLENQRIQKIIQNKIDQETLRYINNIKQQQKQQKVELVEQFNVKSHFGYEDPLQMKSKRLTELEAELKKQMQLKWLRQVQADLQHKVAIDYNETQKLKSEEKLNKSYEKVQNKIKMEKRYQQIEAEERSKALKSQLQLDEKRKEEIQFEMHQIILKEKERLEKFAIIQKMELEEQMRQAMKVQILHNLKKEKEKYYNSKEKQDQKQITQNAFREEIRKKLEKSYNIEKQLESQRLREEKNYKLKLVQQRFDKLEQNIQKENQNSLILEQKQQQNIINLEVIKQNIVNIPDLRVTAFSKKNHLENEKKKLREDFQLELFAYKRPEIYETHDGEFLVKNFKSVLDNQEHLNAKVKVHQEALQKNILQKFMKNELDEIKSEKSDQFCRFSEQQRQQKQTKQPEPQQKINKKKQKQQSKNKIMQIVTPNDDEERRLKLNMTLEEYNIYKKKKISMDCRRDQQMLIQKKNQREAEKKRMEQVIEDFQMMSIIHSQDEELKNQPKSNVQINNQDLDQIFFDEKNHRQEDKLEHLEMKKKESQNIQEVMRLTVHSKIESREKKRFFTSDEDSSEKERKKSKKKNKLESKILLKRQKVKNQKNSLIEEIKQKQFQQHIKRKYKDNIVKLIKIQQQNLKQLIDDHFKNLPKLQKQMQLLKKEQLIKSVLEEKTFSMIEVVKEQKRVGLGVVVFNENKKNLLRSLNMIHFGVYEEGDYLGHLLECYKYVFQNDPCEEIAFSLFYDKEISEQEQFVKAFEKQFDPHGSIFQKKIFNSQFQRKHIVKRLIGDSYQKTKHSNQVSLGIMEINQFLFNFERSLEIKMGYLPSGKTMSIHGILSSFLSKYASIQSLQKLISENKQKNDIKYLSTQVLKLKQSKDNINLPEIEQFINPFQMNLRLIQHYKQQLIKCNPSIQEHPNKSIICCQNIDIQLPYNFISNNLLYQNHQGQAFKANYFRFCSKNKSSKMFRLKSTLYSTTMTIIPTKNNKYKLLLLDALEFDELKHPMALDIYLKLFLNNINSHQLASEQHIWIPQIQAKDENYVQENQIFGYFSQIRTNICFKHTDYLGNSLITQPNHKDLFFAPPFILGVLSSEIQKISEGSPIFAKKIDTQDLVNFEILTQRNQSD